MNIPVYSLIAAGLMPILWTGTAKVIGGQSRRFNNRDTRAWQAGLSGLPARAHAAHLNSFEAFPLFATAVLLARQMPDSTTQLDLLCIIYVALRLGYGICYLADRATLRSLVWLTALGINLMIFRLALTG